MLDCLSLTESHFRPLFNVQSELAHFASHDLELLCAASVELSSLVGLSHAQVFVAAREPSGKLHLEASSPEDLVVGNIFLYDERLQSVMPLGCL